MRRLQFAALAFLLTTRAGAQSAPVCLGQPATGKQLICLIPGVYGPTGLNLANTAHKGHFEDSFLASTTSTPLSAAIGAQSSLLPLASPSSGLTFTWDPIAKAFAPSTDSLGPILGERADTVGKHRIFLGFSYQYFNFDSLDGVSLKNLRFAFSHQDDNKDNPPTVCSISPRDTTVNEGGCAFVRDVVKTTNRVDLKIHQFTTFINFGLTNRIDISAAIPFENVRMAVSSDATVVHNDIPGLYDHFFDPRSDCPAPLPPPLPGSPSPGCLQQTFSHSNTASGIGDVTFRIKGAVWKDERAAIAVGADVRVPTGDELNFLGSGAIGVTPFAVFSYRSRISPHILVGYQSNESSVLAGDISNGKKARLPSEVTYSGGADIWITKGITAALDLFGEQVHQARRIASTTLTELGACTSTDPTCTDPNTFAAPNEDPNLFAYTRSYNITNAALGVKVRPIGKLLITANVTLKLNDGGLRAKAVPLVAASYTF